MKLSDKSKNELRERIIRLVNKVPYGQRVHLDKELLEDLLFEVIVLGEENNIILKLPVWSGEFLRKIDLSEVDFTNVSWNILGCEEDEVEFIINSSTKTTSNKSVIEKITKIRTEMRKNYLDSRLGYIVDYSWTNANIDLTKSFEAIHQHCISISECNFTGVDLSQLDLTEIENLYLTHSSIGKTNLSIPSNLDILGLKSSFEGIDLSSRTIYAGCYLAKFEEEDLAYCNLCNTGINIDLSASDLTSEYDCAIYMAMTHCWVGCYVNGKKVLALAEEPTVDVLSLNEPTELDFIDDVIDDLQGQVRRLKK